MVVVADQYGNGCSIAMALGAAVTFGPNLLIAYLVIGREKGKSHNGGRTLHGFAEGYCVRT